MRWTYREVKPPEWSRWFAWYPVHTGPVCIQGGATVIWLEWVERKSLGMDRGGAEVFEYRIPANTGGQHELRRGP